MQHIRPTKSSWIVSSFGDICRDDKEDTKNVKKRLHSVDTPPIAKRPCKTVTAFKPTLENQLWVEKYSPTSLDQLAVHKKKVEEVKSFLQECFDSKSHNRILLLTGPAGAGKTATLHVLAKDQNFEIVEWLNKSGVPQLYGSNIFDESQAATFRDFLIKSNRYSSSQIFGNQQSTRKIILIEEFPTAFFKDKTEFHNAIRQFIKMGTCPLVFIITDTTKNDSNENSLLPVAFKLEIQPSSISFNPISQTCMAKALNRVATAEGIDVPTSTVTHLIDSTSGDIRAAINALQFRFKKDAKLLSVPIRRLESTSRNKTKSNGGKRMDKVDSPFASKDQSLYLFHALGKILHCKRNYGEKVMTSMPDVLRSKERCPLLVDPEDTWEKTSATAERFGEFLHENYLSFFDTLEDASEACDYFSHGDTLTSDWQDKSLLEPYVASLVSRGIMHSNTKQTSSGWKPLVKPKMFQINRTYKEKSDLGKQLFKEKYYSLSKEDLLCQITPYLLKLQPGSLTAEQITYLRDVTRINSSKSNSRFQSDYLNERDICDANTDLEEPIFRHVEQLALNLSISDKDILIEEYDD